MPEESVKIVAGRSEWTIGIRVVHQCVGNYGSRHRFRKIGKQGVSIVTGKFLLRGADCVRGHPDRLAIGLSMIDDDAYPVFFRVSSEVPQGARPRGRFGRVEIHNQRQVTTRQPSQLQDMPGVVLLVRSELRSLNQLIGKLMVSERQVMAKIDFGDNELFILGQRDYSQQVAQGTPEPLLLWAKRQMHP